MLGSSRLAPAENLGRQLAWMISRQESELVFVIDIYWKRVLLPECHLHRIRYRPQAGPTERRPPPTKGTFD